MAGECPTWFREAEDGTCECGSDLGGVVRCNKYTETVSIATGFCMTYDTESNQTLAGVCRASYPRRLENINHTHSMGYFTIPACLSYNVLNRSSSHEYLDLIKNILHCNNYYYSLFPFICNNYILQLALIIIMQFILVKFMTIKISKKKAM